MSREIGIGFGSSSVPLDRLPGWEPESLGYHGDDGKLYHASGEGKPWPRPPFYTGDVVGCGISFEQRHVYFTRNGELLDLAFKNLTFDSPMEPKVDDIYPMIGMRSPGEHVHVNFGKE